jgi:membrane-associated phospholipid phosphatase
MKIGALITTYALVSFFSVAFPEASVYMHPWLDVIEGTALGSFFLLLCDYISPSQEQREIFFATKPKCGIRWFKVRWLASIILCSWDLQLTQ